MDQVTRTITREQLREAMAASIYAHDPEGAEVRVDDLWDALPAAPAPIRGELAELMDFYRAALARHESGGSE